jgi:hypothetical protein
MILKLKPLSLCSLLIVPLACQRQSTPNALVTDSAFQKPTVTEVFNLRTKCAELGDKILRLHPVGAPFTQDQTSHYDPKTNRCYVDLVATDYKDSVTETLFDGHSREMLVWIETKKGKVDGFYIQGSYENSEAEARRKIMELMADD